MTDKPRELSRRCAGVENIVDNQNLYRGKTNDLFRKEVE